VGFPGSALSQVVVSEDPGIAGVRIIVCWYSKLEVET